MRLTNAPSAEGPGWSRGRKSVATHERSVPAEPCQNCGGAGVVHQRRTLDVTIPAGMIDGSKMRLKGQGGKGPRSELNGDLILTLRLPHDDVFTVNGRDVRCTLPVWDYEAALGAEVTAPSVGGKVSLKIPSGSQSGRVMRLEGQRTARSRQRAGGRLVLRA